MTIPDEAVQQDKTLWCVNIKGPDDIISVPDHLSAVRMANTFNAWWLDLITKKPLTDNHPRIWAEPIEWPFSEGHGEDVTDPDNEYHWLRELAAHAPSPRAQALEEARRQAIEDVLGALTAHELYQYRPKAFQGFIDYARNELSSQPVAGRCKTVDELAAYLCDEFDFDLNPVRGASWPEHENDEGKRDGGYVRLQPSDVQAYARENAKRILAFLGLPASPGTSV